VLKLCSRKEPFSSSEEKASKTPYPALSSINKLLGKLVNLRELKLGIGNINDATMAVVGSTCPHLK
jgi:hypothetical protein